MEREKKSIFANELDKETEECEALLPTAVILGDLPIQPDAKSLVKELLNGHLNLPRN